MNLLQPPGRMVTRFCFASKRCECVDPETDEGRRGCERCGGLGTVDGSGHFDAFAPDVVAPEAGRVREVRQAAGLSLRGGAARLGLSVVDLSSLERGLLVPADGDWTGIFAAMEAACAPKT